MGAVLANITGDWYWILIALVVLFGGSQLPKLAKNTGEALKEFRKAHSDASSGPSSANPPPGPQPAAASGAQPERAAPAQLQAGTPDERVTLTRSELDALLADREAHAREQVAKPEA